MLEANNKALGVGQFDAKSLLHNLEERDYGKPLSELRDHFWQLPRLSLLPNGDQDLKNAIWEAIVAGDLAIVDSAGNPREAYSASQINLVADAQRLRRTVTEKPTEPEEGPGGTSPPGGGGEDPPIATEKKVAVSATLAVGDDNRDAVRVVLDALRNSVEDGALSWMQISVQATMSPDAAEDFDTKAKTSGMHATVTDL